MVSIAARIAREGLAVLLQQQKDFRILAQVGDWSATLESCLRLRPDVLILSTRVTAPDGSTGIAHLHSRLPKLRVLAFTPHDEETCRLLNPPPVCALQRTSALSLYQTRCLDVSLSDGAMGAIHIASSPQDIHDAIRSLASGHAFLEPNAFLARTPRFPLSNRERNVARLVGLGYCNKEIAASLDITDETTKKHITHILRKLGLEDRLQLGLSVVRHPTLFAECSGSPKPSPISGEHSRLRVPCVAISRTRTRA